MTSCVWATLTLISGALETNSAGVNACNGGLFDSNFKPTNGGPCCSLVDSSVTPINGQTWAWIGVKLAKSVIVREVLVINMEDDATTIARLNGAKIYVGYDDLAPANNPVCDPTLTKSGIYSCTDANGKGKIGWTFGVIKQTTNSADKYLNLCEIRAYSYNHVQVADGVTYSVLNSGSAAAFPNYCQAPHYNLNMEPVDVSSTSLDNCCVTQALNDVIRITFPAPKFINAITVLGVPGASADYSMSYRKKIVLYNEAFPFATHEMLTSSLYGEEKLTNIYD